MRQSVAGILTSRPVRIAARLALGGAFAYAGLIKVISPREFARIVVNYHVLPETAAAYLAYLLPWLELTLGLFLVAGVGVRKTALALSALLLSFAFAVLIKTMNGSAAPCGCFSLKASGPESILLTIGRDLALLACGAYLIVFPGAGASRPPARS